MCNEFTFVFKYIIFVHPLVGMICSLHIVITNLIHLHYIFFILQNNFAIIRFKIRLYLVYCTFVHTSTEHDILCSSRNTKLRKQKLQTFNIL